MTEARRKNGRKERGVETRSDCDVECDHNGSQGASAKLALMSGRPTRRPAPRKRN